jgi:hypothetical protein
MYKKIPRQPKQNITGKNKKIPSTGNCTEGEGENIEYLAVLN